jgi:TPP-dependent pyruvate/acetoin dehydrogenase alpha subunit
VAVYEVAREAVNQARSGLGPTLIECKTYRQLGHFEGDPGVGYRTKDEVADWKKRDPVVNIRNRVIAESVASAEELDNIFSEVETEVERAYEYARAAGEADPSSVTNFVFSS